MVSTSQEIRTIGELKHQLKHAKLVFVWVNCWGEDGEYIQVSKSALKRALSIEIDEDDNGHGGKPNGTAIRARIEGDELYVN